MRYVAVGDSFTEGVGDEPDGIHPRGWADLVAEGLAAEHGGVEYANLAIRGRLLEPIATEQIDAALALDPLPTLLTFNGGGNDMLRPGSDLAGLIELTRAAVRRCTAAGIEVVLLAGADPSSGLPFGEKIRGRGEYLTTEIATLAADEDLTFVDMFHDSEIRRPAYWSDDRLHLNPIGHQRVAAHVLRALGVHTIAIPDRPTAPISGYRWTEDLRFTRSHLAPWVIRRLRGRSSGDSREAKHPMWTAVEPRGASR
ncbi:SGNH/GDSL hydrolase family protein [Gordonia hankookensis]|uniref:SGNH/GDSL hydrolase family protein n=1 Tax=Gordonia hankookensis TaxID=589403 RepID=A0ABR7W7Z5_9ACTN|nr:SGNH/GDSL hydrolase family protein [Gordonia hankookensis]MBD1318646.1 SGNH/GDSL hydrolase family protein [Gordonia hankookensis]